MMSKSLRVFCVTLALSLPSAAQAQRQSVPSPEYYNALRVYLEGDYPTALQAFRSAARGGVRSTEGLWVDSICYHAMMGECCYRMGDLGGALDQYNAALELAAFHSDWLLRVQFRDVVEPSASSVRGTITWGTSARNTGLARIPDTILSLQGRSDNLTAIQRGGVVSPPGTSSKKNSSSFS